MLQLVSHIPNHKSIRNIIFDFGNVICDIDISLSEQKFKEFGPAKTFSTGPREPQSLSFGKLVDQLEKGNITSREFRDAIREHYLSAPSDEAIDEAWNALLLDIPRNRIRMLEKIKDHYHIFLLSNSNEIHHRKYLHDFQREFGYRDFNELFEKAWFSFQIHLKKPDKEIFEFVLSDSGLLPVETLFIDDTLIHIESARRIGINGYHLQQDTEIRDLFRIQR
jgi:putative hydrolase of the HAD superfamily